MAGGHGGKRPGSGRKPKDRHLRGIDGGANKRPLVGVPTTNSSTATAEIEEFDAPDALTGDERRVWLKLAPDAFKKRTLTRATAFAFELLCRNIVLMDALSMSPLERGNANHRGMIQRVQADLQRFDLSPCGKPIYEAEEKPKDATADPLARFIKRAT